ncbi:MAG: hypothetical protein J1G04_06820, partial [Clostridiales bacterium]|nr:hypothetical protein [Clostridiales bacterium]
LIGENHSTYLSDFQIPSGYKKVVLFPTYDVYLNKKQYMALKSFLKQVNEDNFYALNYYTILNDDSYCVLDDHNIIYQINRDTSYKEYTDLFLVEMSYIVSKNFDWFIVMEENRDAGAGFFVARDDLIELFQKNYPQYLLDLEAFNKYNK